jgi:spermidine/putrescine transport system ATP-binding protein
MARRQPHELSGGQKQRVALARALVNEPAILLLDEPMSALDARLRRDVQVELRALQRRLGTTFILVTHDQEEAMTVSDRILVMKEGRIEQQGAPEQVYERPASRFVAEFLGAANLIAAERDDDAFETALGRLVGATRADWSKGTLAIRPEHVALSSSPAAANAVQVLVVERVYRGDHVELRLEPGGLRARCTAPGGHAPGDRIWAELPAEHLHALRD